MSAILLQDTTMFHSMLLQQFLIPVVPTYVKKCLLLHPFFFILSCCMLTNNATWNYELTCCRLTRSNLSFFIHSIYDATICCHFFPNNYVWSLAQKGPFSTVLFLVFHLFLPFSRWVWLSGTNKFGMKKYLRCIINIM
jgi:hypothetical protein